MSTYTPRLTAPDEDNAYYYADNPFYQSGYGLPNCTCYAFGRFWEITGGDMPSLSWGNAENWYTNTSDGYSRGTVPKLGAVICWRKGEAGDSDDGAGHVAIVEAINDDGSIVTGESGWGASSVFWTTTRADDGNWGQSNAYTFQGFIYNPIDFDSEDSEAETDHPYAEYIWNYFMGKLGNAYGVAGLMGNLEAESGLYPNIVEGDVPISSTSKNYTLLIDALQYTRASFISDGLGYGLAQWTYSTRKAGLYDMWQSGGYSSIGAIELACDYLYYELYTSFTGVLSTLVSATSIREASDAVLHDFENPAVQTEDVEEYRASLGQAWYEIFTGSSTGGNTGGGSSTAKKGMSLLMMFMTIRGDI